MPTITSVPPGSSEEDKKPGAFSSPSEEQNDYPATTYDTPPTSWFFNRGSKDNSDHSEMENETYSENYTQGKEDDSSPSPNNHHPSSGTEHHDSSTYQPNSNPDCGMVSDNDDEEDDDDFERFDFVAISKSLMLTDPSFDHVKANQNEPPKFDSDVKSLGASGDQGLLILDATDTNSEDSRLAVAPNHHNPDASMLTVPGSDSLPSDIGSISSGDGILEEDNQNEQDADDTEEPQQPNYPPLINRFFNNLRQNRRLRLVSDASDENNGENASGVSIVRDDDEFSMAWTMSSIEDHFCAIPRKFFWRRRSLIFFLGVLFGAGLLRQYALISFRKHRKRWIQRIETEKESMQRLLVEHESLRREMEILVEEAAVATARAESLAREQARLLIQRQEAEKAEKERIRLLQEQEQKKRKERERRREQPWRSTSGKDDEFRWFFEDGDEKCFKHRDGESATFTIADNCWVKAKADVNLGNCGSDTKDYFSDIWKNLFRDWEFYFNDPTSSSAIERYSTSMNDGESNGGYDKDYNKISGGNDEQNRDRDYDDQERHYQYEDDTYYPPEDPLQDLISIIQSAGESFVDKLTNLVNNEVESSQTIAQEMEETITRRFLAASQTVSDAIEFAKEDIGDLSVEVLSVLRTAVQKNGSGNNNKKFHSTQGENPSTPTQEVTRKGLFDAATVLSMLSKSVTRESAEN